MNCSESSLSELCDTGQISELLKSYIELCSAVTEEEDTESDPKRKKSNRSRAYSKAMFPNLAGFCRYLGIGTQELEAIASEHPAEYGKILAVLEDEALNSDLSATLISTYLKKRLGYDESAKSRSASSQLEICFEHDILEDGA